MFPLTPDSVIWAYCKPVTKASGCYQKPIKMSFITNNGLYLKGGKEL